MGNLQAGLLDHRPHRRPQRSGGRRLDVRLPLPGGGKIACSATELCSVRCTRPGCRGLVFASPPSPQVATRELSSDTLSATMDESGRTKYRVQELPDKTPRCLGTPA